MKKIKKVLKEIVKWAYFPVYIVFIFAHAFVRLLLAITYLGLLDTRIATDIFLNLFGRQHHGGTEKNTR